MLLIIRNTFANPLTLILLCAIITLVILYIRTLINYVNVRKKNETTKEIIPKDNIILITNNEDLIKKANEQYSALFNIFIANFSELNDNLPSEILFTIVDNRENKIELSKTKNLASRPYILLKNILNKENQIDYRLLNQFVIATIIATKSIKTGIIKEDGDQTKTKQENTVQRCKEIILANLDNTQFSVNELAQKCNLSVYLLNKKLRASIGENANSFIKEIRLKKAASLLAKTNKTITEISYMVGSNDMKYFRESFSKQYGMSPSQYRQQHSKNAQKN